MEFIYDFTEGLLIEIVRQALKQGYKLQVTEWVDEWEREEGCPSICHELEEKDYENYEEDIYSILPDSSIYSRGACVELNIVSDDDYICFYHDECCDRYICKESLEFINLDELETWFNEETLELVDKNALIFLHGKCHNWTKEHYRENDKLIAITELNEETGLISLIHCCIKRNENYIDVRGITPEFDEILEGFDYGDYEVFEYTSLDNFIAAINKLGIKFE